MELDAYIEIPKPGPERDAFIGDRAWSPLAMALASAMSEVAIKRVVVPLDRWPGELIGEVRHEWLSRLQCAGVQDAPDAADRAVATRMRNWVPTGSLHGALMTTEACTHGNPTEMMAALGGECRTFVILLSGRHAFATPSGVAQMAGSAARSGWGEAIYLADGPQGIVPSVWSREAIEHMRDHGRVAQSLILGRRFWGSRFLHMPTEVIRCRRSFLLTTSKGRAFCGAVASVLRERGFSTNPLTSTAPLPTMQDVCNAATDSWQAWVGDAPWDIEIEVTTDRPYDPIWLPPRRAKKSMSLSEFQAVIDGLGDSADSVTVTIGGEGDPLLNESLGEMAAYAASKCRGVALKTMGAGLTEEKFGQILKWPLDLMIVRLGAFGEEASRLANGVGGHDALWALLKQMRIRQGEAEPAEILPLIVPEVVKTRVGESTVVDFYTKSREASLWPMVSPPMEYAGACEPHGTLDKYPGSRYGCVRLANQMVVLADGSIPLCTQLSAGDQPRAGTVMNRAVADVWKSEVMAAARIAHSRGEWAGANPACVGCNQWHQLC